MKKIAAICLFLSITLTTKAQQRQPVIDSFHFAKKIPVGLKEGRHFRYEMAVSTNASDDFAGLSFYGVAAKGNNAITTHRFKTVEKRTEQDWTIFTIEGILPGDADEVWFYTSVTKPGTYYFDDLSLYVESTRGSWKQLNIVNHSFEQSAGGEVAGFAVRQSPAGNPKAILSERVAKTGKFSLMITYIESKDATRFAAGED